MGAATILVTDGAHRAALAAVRSLGRAGYRVIVTDPTPRSLAGGSRWCDTEVVTPDPLADPAGFADRIAEVVARESAAVVLPITEPSVLALLPARDRLAPARIPLSSLDAFNRASDKALLMRLAPELGIAVPAQREIASADELAALDPESLSYPLVVKPARSIGGDPASRSKQSVHRVASPSALRAHAATLPDSAYPLLLQQRVVGPGIGIFLLLWEGRVVAQFAHRRIREKPPAGGVSVYRESIAPDPELVERSRRLLERCGLEGVAMVEYKVDQDTGTPFLMEINGRFWGSLQLAVDAGVDFPRLLVESALGKHPAPVLRYRIGVRSRWWWGDLDHLLARLRYSSAKLALPPGAPSRWRVVLDFLKLWRPGDRNEVFRLSDPRPFWRESVAWIQRR